MSKSGENRSSLPDENVLGSSPSNSTDEENYQNTEDIQITTQQNQRSTQLSADPLQQDFVGEGEIQSNQAQSGLGYWENFD